jgi:chromosome segregation ATPase
MPEPEVKTGVDALMKLLKENGRMEISDAASKLGVSIELVEDWATALEKANLIKIEHLMTKIYLLPITLTEQEAKLKEKELTGIKEGVKREVAIEEATLKGISERLSSLNQKWKSVEEVVNTQLKELNQRLDELEKLREKSEEIKQQIYKNIKDFEAPTKQIDQTLSNYATMLQQIQNETIPKLEERKNSLFKEIEKTSEEVKNIEKVINDSNQKLQSFITRINELEKSLIAVATAIAPWVFIIFV